MKVINSLFSLNSAHTLLSPSRNSVFVSISYSFLSIKKRELHQKALLLEDYIEDEIKVKKIVDKNKIRKILWLFSNTIKKEIPNESNQYDIEA